MQQAEDLIEAVDGDYFADTSVVIRDGVFLIVRGIVIAHADFRAADECGVAEEDPRFFGAGEERFPETLKGCGCGLGIAGKGAGSGLSSQEKSQERASQGQGKDNYGEEPGAGTLIVDRGGGLWKRGSGAVAILSGVPFGRRERVCALRQYVRIV